MTTENQVQSISLEANADLSSSQFLFIVPTSGKAAVAGDGVAAIGVLQNNPPSGGAAQVAYAGVTKVKASAAISVGAKIASTAAGKAVTAASGKHAVGIALAAASADGDIIPMLLGAPPLLA